MLKNDVHSCPSCNTSVRVRGTNSLLLTCPKCSALIKNEKQLAFTASAPPDDWSIIQLGVTGKHKDKSFEVIGLVRLQLQQEYKNYWCIWYDQDQKYGWIAESLGKYFVCEGSLFSRDDDGGEIYTTKAGDKFELQSKVLVTVDYADRCTWVSVQGEIAHWLDYVSGFESLQCINNSGIVAYFNLNSKTRKVNFIVGEVVEVDSLELKGIREWDEWK